MAVLFFTSFCYSVKINDYGSFYLFTTVHSIFYVLEHKGFIQKKKCYETDCPLWSSFRNLPLWKKSFGVLASLI